MWRARFLHANGSDRRRAIGWRSSANAAFPSRRPCFSFHIDGHTLNLLDTPGHQDFGEDTYRTLLAADSAVMLIDAAKGVEPQTKKLFAICRERGVPLFTFMNKLDRPSRDPLELLDELESVSGIGAFPMNWPLGNGPDFKGVYDRATRTVHCFERAAHGATRAAVSMTDVSDPRLQAMVKRTGLRSISRGHRAARRRGAAIRSRGDAARDITPVFFGSAVTNFGVQLFLDEFVEMAPSPSPRGGVDPGDPRSRVSCSRSKRTWIHVIATALHSCAFARGSSSET